MFDRPQGTSLIEKKMIFDRELEKRKMFGLNYNIWDVHSPVKVSVKSDAVSERHQVCSLKEFDKDSKDEPGKRTLGYPGCDPRQDIIQGLQRRLQAKAFAKKLGFTKAFSTKCGEMKIRKLDCSISTPCCRKPIVA